jgi:hypothetical protein
VESFAREAVARMRRVRRERMGSGGDIVVEGVRAR